jgi:2-C-methyl-D-erythritol 4-phosphate cytidylyltransferase
VHESDVTRYWLVLPAAGGGSRFGGALPKQYAPLLGSTVIEHALAPFLADHRCMGIAVALSPGDQWFAKLPVARHPALRTVTGGAARSDSVRMGLASLPAADADWVLVHDAARPCVSRDEINALLAGVLNDPVGGLLALQVTDTLKLGDEHDRVSTTASRSSHWRALTPQMFRAGLLRDALARATQTGQIPTDESQAIEWLGHFPRLVCGSARNIKVTQAADLALAEALLKPGGAAR